MAQVRSPSQNDWVSQVIKDLEEIDLDIEFEDIENTSKEKFKDIVLSHAALLKKKESRISDNAKGRNIIYKVQGMQNYLQETDIEITLDEKKWLFKCRTDDIDIKGNFCWKYESHSCISCKLDILENNEHLLNCKQLIGRNEIISYIPSYKELFEDDLDEQVYVSRILRVNFSIRKTFFREHDLLP